MALKQAEQAMVRAKSAALKPSGVTLAQYVALVELDRQPGLTGADDRRGREALAAGRRLAEPVERQVLGSFSADELEVLGALLARWARAFEAGRPDRS